MKTKWQEKSASISGLEEKVKQMKDGWTEKEKKLTDDRDKAVKAAE